MRRPVVLPDVRLDFDDPRDPPTRAIDPDQARAEERTGGRQRVPGQEVAIEDR
jgi:hypothetical protein